MGEAAVVLCAVQVRGLKLRGEVVEQVVIGRRRLGVGEGPVVSIREQAQSDGCAVRACAAQRRERFGEKTNGVLIAQSPIYRVPYLRVQGGVSALIIDPAEGDIGVALFAERDITAFKDTLQDGAAATERQFSSGDALYLGGFLNGAPAQYVRLRPGAGGIDVITPGAMNLRAGGVATLSAAQFVVNAPTTFNDTVSGTKAGAGNYSFPNLAVAGVNLETHKHTNVQPGTGNSGGPTN